MVVSRNGQTAVDWGKSAMWMPTDCLIAPSRQWSASVIKHWKHRRIGSWTFCGAAVVALLATSPTLAQTRADVRRPGSDAAKVVGAPTDASDDQGKGDSERVDDSFQPKGIDLGSFLLLPQIENEVTYNSNVFAQESSQKSDFIARIAPEFRLRSRFSNHALNFTGRVEQFLFRDYTSDNHLDAVALVDGRYDIERNWEVNGFSENFRRSEDRGSPDDVGGKKPTLTYGTVNRVGSKYQTGRYTFGGEFSAARRIFEDVDSSTGTTINNSDRNRWEYLALGRGAYEMFPGYLAVVEASANKREYDSRLDDAGFNRSSSGYRVETGIGLDISQLIRGDFLVGYLKQDYEDPRYKDPSGLSFKATFNWTPSRITVVVPAIERSVQETTTNQASAMVRSSASILVRHEYQRNIVLTGYGSVSYDEYEGINQASVTYETRARVIYALAPEYYVGSEIGYRRRNSEIDGQSYGQGVLSLRFGLRM